MKTKTLKKLVLTKKTVADLNELDMLQAKGGVYTEDTVCATKCFTNCGALYCGSYKSLCC